MSNKTHEEWLVLVKQKFWEDKGEKAWFNAKQWSPKSTGLGDRYCKSEEEAREVLAHAYKLWNGEKIYDAEGKRYETSPAGYLSVSVECTKETDADLMIVKHRIKKRIVTEWEVIE